MMERLWKRMLQKKNRGVFDEDQDSVIDMDSLLDEDVNSG